MLDASKVCQNAFKVIFNYSRKYFRNKKLSEHLKLCLQVPYFVVTTLAIIDTVWLTKQFILRMIGAQEEMSADIQLYLSNFFVGANILLRTGLFVSLQCHAEKYVKVLHTVAVSSYSKHLYTKQVS